jgi:hypothetical protein
MAPHVMVEDISVKAISEARQAFTGGGLRERLAKFHADVDCAFWQWNEVWLSAGFRRFDIRSQIEAITAPLRVAARPAVPPWMKWSIMRMKPAPLESLWATPCTLTAMQTRRNFAAMTCNYAGIRLE